MIRKNRFQNTIMGNDNDQVLNLRVIELEKQVKQLEKYIKQLENKPLDPGYYYNLIYSIGEPVSIFLFCGIMAILGTAFVAKLIWRM